MNRFGDSVTRRGFCVGSTVAGLLAAVGKAEERRDVPWLEEIQRPPQKLPADVVSLSPPLVTRDGAKITTVAAWEKKRKELGQQWLEFLGSLKLDLKHRPPLKVLHEETVEGIVRQRVAYEIEPGVRTEAYVLRPAKAGEKRPGVAVFHSTVNHSILQPAGLGTDSEKAFGFKLAQRGNVCICPRNFLWPDNEHIAADGETKRFQQRHPGVMGMAKMLYDSIVAVNLLEQIPGVDPQRIGAVGHSLGAKEVLYLAAFDERIRATVSSEGGIGTRFSNWDAAWYLGPAIKTAEFHHEHHELLAMIAPRAFLLIGGESADGDKGWPFIEAALPVYRLFDSNPRLGQYNHRLGHAVPPASEQRIYEWLETYL